MGKALTVDQAATYMNVTTRTIYRWLESGKLQAEKFGRDWMIERAALDALKQQEQEKN